MHFIKFIFFLFFINCQSLCFATIEDTFNHIKADPNALYAFFKNMPKGGELHYHLSGGAYPETMLEIAAHGNYCLNQQNYTMYVPAENCIGIKSSQLIVQPSDYAQTVRAWSFKNFLAGSELNHDHFFNAFYKFNAIVIDNIPFLLKDIMLRAANQHEQYMEILIMPDNAQSTKIIQQPLNGQNYDALRQQLLANPQYIDEIKTTVKKTHDYLLEARRLLTCDKNINQPVCQLTIKFQYYVLREQSLEKVFMQALHGFAAASESDDIVAVNLVQPEDGMISLRDYHEQMKIFAYLHKIYPNVHIALHAGELAPQEVVPKELRFHIHEALKIGHASRIGHGIDIAYEDNAAALINHMAANKIPVEISLTSNEKILGIAGAAHPINFYLAHHVPVVLSTDDEGILRTDLTTQYVKAALEYGIDYPTIKLINRNALTYSFLPGKSLWLNEKQAEPVAECKNLTSAACMHFIKDNEKATLQRSLELKLLAFEQANAKGVA